MFFSIIAIILIFFIFRKQKIESVQEKSKTEIVFCFSWLFLYMLLAVVSSVFDINIINETSNWIFFVFFPLLILSGLRKEKVKETIKEIGLKPMEKKTGIRVLLVCFLYIGVIFFLFSLSDEVSNMIMYIPKMLVKFSLYFCLMILTAAFTEEFFFRGILQNHMLCLLKRPYIAILLVSILFGLYHFPFAYFLWDGTAGNAMASLKAVMTEQAVSGCALGFMYYKSNRNLWSSIILHACTNAAIVSLSVVFPE